MDFTPELSAFQGLIVSIDHVHKLSRLTSRGGREEEVKLVLDSISRFLKNEKFINENGVVETMASKTRTFAMYLVLNTDLKVLKDMVEFEGVFLVISSIPIIPQYLMCEMLWNLHMEDFSFEIITYCYPPLAIEVARAFVENFKYYYPTTCLRKLYKLSAACYSLIGRLQCFDFEKDMLNILLSAGFGTLQKSLNYFPNPPNSHKLNILTTDELFEYKGHRLKAVLLFIYECFNCFTQEVNSNCFHDIYKSTYKKDCFKENLPTNKVCDCPNSTVSECLDNCNSMLMDIFQKIVMDIDINEFCSWSEFEENGITMQKTIGELCYKVQKKLETISSVAEHEVLKMIELFARVPVNINDIINSTDTNEIIQNINSNNEDKASWIHALVNKEQLCQHIELITVIDSNIDMFDEQECLKLYHMFTNYSRTNTINGEIVTSISIKIFQHCNVTDKHKILQENFINNQFHDLSDDESFHSSLTEIFNKIVSNDVDFTEVLNVFIQNPRQVFNKIFILVKENAQLTSTMLKIMDLLKDYSNYYYVTETDPCIIGIVKKILDDTLETEAEQDNLVKFLTGLKNNDIIPGSKLLLLIIMPNMHKALLQKDVGKIHIQVQLLHEAYTINELLEYRAPMLAMLSQVMEIVRWGNLRAFVPKASSTLQLTLNFQKSLMDTYYDDIISNDEADWLRKRLKRKNMQPLNRYYFRKLLDSQCGPNFFESISGMKVDKETSHSEISIWVTQMLSSGTQEEWCAVWENLTRHIEDIDVLGIFQDALRMITKAVENLRTPTTRACLFYCIQNLIYIIRYKFFQEPLTDRQVLSVSFNLSKLLKETNKEDVDDIGSRLMPLFAYLVEKKNLYPTNVPSYFKNTHYYSLVCRAFNSNNLNGST